MLMIDLNVLYTWLIDFVLILIFKVFKVNTIPSDCLSFGISYSL